MAQLIPELKEYLRPESLDTAMQMSKSHGSDARMLAGGTSLAFHKPSVSAVIDISQLPCRGVRWTDDGDLEIGAITTVWELEKSNAAGSFAHGVFLQCTERLASSPLRNLITLGGNIMGGFAWSDLPVVLLALDAELRVYDGKEISIPVGFQGKLNRKGVLANNAILTGVRLPVARKEDFAAFIKFTRTEVDLGLVTVAAAFQVKDGCYRNLRLACGSVTAAPQRLTAAEEILEGTMTGDAILLEKAGRVAMLEVKPRGDTRASSDFRIDMLRVLVVRAVEKALKGQSNEN